MLLAIRNSIIARNKEKLRAWSVKNQGNVGVVAWVSQNVEHTVIRLKQFQVYSK